MGEVKKIKCPHCEKMVKFERNSAGKWVGTVIGAVGGYWLCSGLGIAGGILGMPVAIPAALVGLGIVAFIGNRIGAMKDDKAAAKCPSCGESVSI